MDNNNSNFRSGFTALLGKPNAGKSTLVNAMSGAKVAITSPRPQTTRHRIMGVKNGSNCQIVFIDTPGVKDVKNELDSFMEKIYKDESKTADVILFVVDGSTPCSDEDKKAYNILKKGKGKQTPVFLVINKSDRMTENKFNEDYKNLGNFDQVFTISAVTGDGLDELITHITSHLPQGPAYFPLDVETDQSPLLFASEIVRENILNLVSDEIPHGIFVHAEEMRKGVKPGSIYFKIMIYVERNSHKGIIIGKEGKMLKKIGMRSRKEISMHMNQDVFLDLWVKVKEKWKDRKDLLRAWGY